MVQSQLSLQAETFHRAGSLCDDGDDGDEGPPRDKDDDGSDDGNKGTF